MFDYKFDQDRLFDHLDDLSDCAEASDRERQQKYKNIIDKGVKALVKAGIVGAAAAATVYDSEDEARAESYSVIEKPPQAA